MKRILFYVFCALFLSSCATHVISKDIRESVTDVSFRVARENVDKYTGQTFIWGGFIAANRMTEEGSFLEIVQNPVDSYGSIIDTDVSQGRFLAFSEKELDPLIYEKGRLVTVAGELTGSKTVKRRNRDYTYPVLSLKEIYLWKEEEYTYSQGYYYPYPYWGPYWDPWPYYYPRRFYY